jgi:hypothetical protein
VALGTDSIADRTKPGAADGDYNLMYRLLYKDCDTTLPGRKPSPDITAYVERAISNDLYFQIKDGATDPWTALADGPRAASSPSCGFRNMTFSIPAPTKEKGDTVCGYFDRLSPVHLLEEENIPKEPTPCAARVDGSEAAKKLWGQLREGTCRDPTFAKSDAPGIKGLCGEEGKEGPPGLLVVASDDAGNGNDGDDNDDDDATSASGDESGGGRDGSGSGAGGSGSGAGEAAAGGQNPDSAGSRVGTVSWAWSSSLIGGLLVALVM